jgi:hypothetical protein
VRDFFELAGELAEDEDGDGTVTVMECCVNFASSPEVKGRALYLASKTLLTMDPSSARGRHYARLAYALYPEEASIRRLHGRLFT